MGALSGANLGATRASVQAEAFALMQASVGDDRG